MRSHEDAVGSGCFVIAWTIAASAVALSVAGLFLNWYSLTWFDEAIHAYAFFAAALVASLHLYRGMLHEYRHHRLVLVCSVICVGLTLGVFWEWGEWCYDRLAGPANSIRGKTDTLVDLVMDGSGALVAGLVLVLMVRRARGMRGG